MEAEHAPHVITGDGEIGLTGLRWKAAGTGPDGKPVSFSRRGTEVLRRQPDGDRPIAVDAPRRVG